MKYPWIVKFLKRKPLAEAHVVPNGDLKRHEFSKNCWCKPLARLGKTPDRLVVEHNPADGRERS